MAKPTTRVALIAVAAVTAVLAAGAAIFVYSGAYNVAATAEHTSAGRWLLSTLQERSVAARAGDVGAPPPADSAALAHGAEHYGKMCEVCHGAPGVERGEIGKGITPEPPDLSEEAAELTARELFWITKHGIKLAGMPAFGPTHTDEELWGVVAFVERLADMSAEEYSRWTEAAQAESGAASAETHAH